MIQSLVETRSTRLSPSPSGCCRRRVKHGNSRDVADTACFANPPPPPRACNIRTLQLLYQQASMTCRNPPRTI